MTFDANPSGIDKLFASIAQKLEEVDRQLREEYTGLPVADIEAAAAARFAAAGLNMDPAGIHDYAESVSNDQPFSIELT